MISPISQDNIKTRIFYINDFHGKSINMERAITASNAFNSKNTADVDSFKISSGDIMLGEDKTTNTLAIMFQNIIGIAATAVGNHEYDMKKDVSDILPLAKFKFLATNVKIKDTNPWSKVVTGSTIIDQHNHKYGIIGTSPIDLKKRVKSGFRHDEIQVSDIKTTLQDIQYEINKLKQQGINKIILASHLGYTMDQIVANNTEDLDIILGGHTHDLIFDVKEGKNLFYSKKGEPVVITQAGRDGKNFGILNLEFSQDGVIKRVQNNIGNTKDFNRNAPVKYIFDKIFGNNEIYGHIKTAAPPLKKDLIEENPHAYFIADCMRKDLDSDIAILPAANIRGFFEQGPVDTRNLADILPFKNKLYKIKYSEKDLVECLKKTGTSFNNWGNKPGLFYTSGINYTMSTSGKLKAMSFIDKNGKKHNIDINNPRSDKFYTTVINDYYAQGNDDFTVLYQPKNVIQKYDFDATKCVQSILKRSKEPVNIINDGRIKIVNN